MAKLTDQEVINIYQYRGYTLELPMKYKSTELPLSCWCSNGHHLSITVQRARASIGCPICNSNNKTKQSHTKKRLTLGNLSIKVIEFKTNDLIKIKCNICRMTGTYGWNYLAGIGRCPMCVTRSSDLKNYIKFAVLYWIKIKYEGHYYTKIGVSRHWPQRLDSLPEIIEIIKIKTMPLYLASRIESRFKSRYLKYKADLSKASFGGYTECFIFNKNELDILD